MPKACASCGEVLGVRVSAANGLQGMVDLADRFRREYGGVERNAVLQPLRETLSKLGHGFANRVGHLEGMRPRELIDGYSGRGRTVQPVELAVCLSPQRNPGNVADAGTPATTS